MDLTNIDGLEINNPNGVFWRGQDGQVYVKSDQGTNAAGAWDPNTQNYWASRGYNMIDDPATGTLGATNTTAPTVTSGDGGTLDQAAIDNTRRTIDQIPGLLEAALNTERTRYQNAIRDFGSQRQQQQGQYDESTMINQKNYDRNFMDSIRAGIQGLGGLMNILRGTGASGGTAEDEARDIVGGVTSQDIRSGADTRQQNQRELDTSLSTFLSNLERKKAENEDTFENNQRAVRRESNTQLQDLYGKMAGFYGDANQDAERVKWMNKAGELTPSISQNSRTQLSDYDTKPVEVKAPEITAFSGPTQPNVVAPGNAQTSRGQIGSGIFTIGDRREDERRRSAPVGA